MDLVLLIRGQNLEYEIRNMKVMVKGIRKDQELMTFPIKGPGGDREWNWPGRDGEIGTEDPCP